MPGFGKAYMRPKKLTRKGEGLSTFGGSEPTPAVMVVMPKVAELTVVEPEAVILVTIEAKVAAPADVLKVAARVMESEVAVVEGNEATSASGGS